MNENTKQLNEFISAQVVQLLNLTKNNINDVISFLQTQNNPYLNNSSVQILNNLSFNTAESFNKILINSNIGYVEDNCVDNSYIVLTKYYTFDNTTGGQNKIPYSILFVEKFIQISNDKLVSANYELGDNVVNVINNLKEIIDSIDKNIILYNNMCH